jgi:hypothetical protein
MALACNANAKEEGKQQKEKKVNTIDALPDGKKDKGPYSVPDGGHTVALLGVSVAPCRIAAAQDCQEWSDRLK